jgi:hypothetical protein
MRGMFCKNQRGRAIECLLTESHIHGNMYVWFGGRHGETSHRNMVWRPVSSLHIDRHHIHIVTVNVNEEGKRLNQDFLYRRSKKITTELEEKYHLHKAQREKLSPDTPICKVDPDGDIKRQVANSVKMVGMRWKFQSIGEYNAILGLYNIKCEQTDGRVNGREYHGLVYFATDDNGNVIVTPLKASRLGKFASRTAGLNGQKIKSTSHRPDAVLPTHLPDHQTRMVSLPN